MRQKPSLNISLLLNSAIPRHKRIRHFFSKSLKLASPILNEFRLILKFKNNWSTMTPAGGRVGLMDCYFPWTWTIWCIFCQLHGEVLSYFTLNFITLTDRSSVVSTYLQTSCKIVMGNITLVRSITLYPLCISQVVYIVSDPLIDPARTKCYQLETHFNKHK